MNKGIIQVYTGNGKGKTTAAIGLAFRAYGQGLHVAVFQFLKAPDYSGEYKVSRLLDDALTFVSLGTGRLIINRQPSEEERAQANEGWHQVKKAICSNDYNLIVVDEISHALNLGLVDLQEVLGVLESKPVELELVLTGRDMPSPIIELADLVTEMKAMKHPYDHGLNSRKGIEY